MASWQVAIPSYKRHELLANATLATLDRGGVDRDRVTVWVADAAELEVYEHHLAGGWRVSISAPGLVASRRAYSLSYPAGTPLVNIDDDALAVQVPVDSKLVDYTGDLGAFFGEAFSIASSNGAKLWGLNAAANAFFMQCRWVTGLRYICGMLHGTYAHDAIVTSQKRPHWSNGEDFLTTLMHYKTHGRVLRFDGITVKTKYFGPGGMQSEHGDVERRKADYRQHVPMIARMFPDHAKYVPKGDTGNLKLRSITERRQDYLPPGMA